MIHKYPEDIIHDILFRLPTKSLIRCTSVCKPGNCMIKNPSFIRTQLSRTINLNNQSDAHLLLLYCVRTAPIEEHCNLRYDNLAFDEYCKLEFPILPRDELYNKFLRVVGVCNGLVFLADDKDYLGYTFMLWNPSIRKSVTLPNPHLTLETISKHYACIGFGFNAVTNDYKVVRLITEQCEDPNIFYEVYSLAGGSWSDPRSLDFACEVVSRPKSQAFVNGAIHWEAFCRLTDGGFECFILAFDVGSNSFHRIIAPKNFITSCSTQLFISGDGKSIALSKIYSTNTGESYLDAWVMKEYGMEESWTKLTTLSPPYIQREVPDKPLCFRKSGDVVLVPTEYFLLW